MKITNADIQKVVRDEITAASQKDAKDFPTTDADWQKFKRRFEDQRSADTRSNRKTTGGPNLLSLRNLIAATAALAAVVLLTTLQAPQSTLRLAKADAFRGDTTGNGSPRTPQWIAEQQLDIRWNLAEQTLSFPLLDGTLVQTQLTAAPELNLNDEGTLRFFRLVGASATLRTGDVLQVNGTLQIRAPKLSATDMMPKRLSEVESALFKLKLSAKDDRSQDLWYEFKK